MSAFAENMEGYVRTQNKWPIVKKALEDKNDGSYEEFIEAMGNPHVTTAQIQEAIIRTTGIDISDKSVARWRRIMKYGNL